MALNIQDQFRTYRGLYGGQWDVSVSPYKGADFSRTCYMFTGQGTATPGMFRFAYDKIEIIRRRFDQADLLAKDENLSRPSLYITDSSKIPSEQLSLIRNLATFTLQVALFDFILSRTRAPQLVTGSSQGEYAALVCSGAVNFEEMFSAQVARETQCGPANQLGYLMAIAAGPERIAETLDRQDFYLSIVNSPVRSVIAVAPEKITLVEDMLHREGIGSKILEVPHPYHSPLMHLAAERFRAWVEERGISFRPPRIPMVSSVTRALIPQSGLPAAEAAQLLGEQLVNPVNFIEQIQIAYKQRCFSFLEIGPGGALGTFVQKILFGQEFKILKLDTYLPSAPAQSNPSSKLNPLQRKIFDAVRRAVAKLTGYEIESISIEDNFQDDLGIDSLKKVEILVTIADELNRDKTQAFDLAGIQNLRDTVQMFSSSRDAGMASWAPPKGRVDRHAVVWKEVALDPLPTLRDRSAGAQFVALRSILEKRVRAAEQLEFHTLLLLAEDGDFLDEDGELAARANIDRLLCLFQFFRSLTQGKNKSDLDLFLVTDDDCHPFAKGLAGFFKALVKEHPWIYFKHLHFKKRAPKELLLEIVQAEKEDHWNTDVSYSNGVRTVPVLKPIGDAMATGPVLTDAVVAVIGGAKGITNALLKHFAQRGRWRLYLAGRSAPEEVSDRLTELSRLARHVEYVTVDARNAKEVSEFFSNVHRKHGKIDLVINAAGIERSRALADKELKEMRQELEAKVLSVINVLDAAQTVSAHLVLNFSSIAARWGNPGQTIYCCANNIVNQLTAVFNRMTGRNSALAIEWPPWDGVGMTENPLILYRLRQLGLSLLPQDRAAELFAHDLLQSNNDPVSYVDIRDIPMLRASLADHRPYRPVIGKLAESQRFERVLDLQKDRWLVDHIIDGTSYLPAAAAMTMAFCVGSLLETFSGRMRDFRMLQPVTIGDEPIRLSLALTKTANGTGVLGNGGTTHFCCRLCENSSRPNQDKMCFRDDGKLIDPRLVYSKNLLFHGPTFQVLHVIRVTGSGELEAKIETEKLLAVFGDPRSDLLTLWIDGAFQALGLAAAMNTNSLAIPISVDEIIVHDFKDQQKAVSVKPTNMDIGNEHVGGDVVVIGDDGKPIIQLVGIKMKILRTLREEVALSLMELT